jgi:hypothetical protein
MGTDSSTQRFTAGVSRPDGGGASAGRRRFVHVSESTPMRDIIDVAMVGLIGGGPRLAIRAARVLLEDSYSSRTSARRARVRRRPRFRGE